MEGNMSGPLLALKRTTYGSFNSISSGALQTSREFSEATIMGVCMRTAFMRNNKPNHLRRHDLATLPNHCPGTFCQFTCISCLLCIVFLISHNIRAIMKQATTTKPHQQQQYQANVGQRGATTSQINQSQRSFKEGKERSKQDTSNPRLNIRNKATPNN